MELTWLGHSCFRIRGKDVTVLTDPPAPTTGYSLGRINADIVTISHTHPGHSYEKGIGNSPYIVRGPGEYEIKNVLITGVQTYHDDERGARLGRNTAYVLHIDDLLICHLGDLGHVLDDKQQEIISGCDVLLLPVGGGNALDAKRAVEVIGQVEPQVIVPMHYATPALKASAGTLDPVEKFFHEMGVEVSEPLPKLTLTRGSLPPEPQVVLLAYRG
ncbi:MAG TPA: MBL fold metallo-hydrolase [Ktedonobacterales bacterium]|jgi:L-ascorbate metabolism protein UlaG (beta-lactamase superfamily)|nr:MBL fold metallo-hydrolase [Ktedonobacterales bacterium]